MKKISFIQKFRAFGLIALLFMSQSCSDLLKEEVISNIGNNYINSAAGFNDAVKSAYSALRIFYGTQQGLTLTEYGTDIYATGADGGYKGFHFYDSQLQPTVDYLAVVWDELYKGINTCNAVLDRSANVTGVTDAIKKQRIAEVKFLRAHYYFILLQQWGALDLRLSETLEPTKKATRASETDVYKAIIADLEASLPDLENKAKSVDYGRATKAASENLLAKVYLTKATSSAKAADDYAKSATYASNVINNYGFKLVSDFAGVFDQASQEHSEVVFAVQYTTDPLTNAIGNELHLFFGMQYDTQVGMIRDIVYGRPFKRLRPTAYLINEVFKDRINDSRYKKTFRDTWLSNNPGTFNTAFDISKPKVTYKAGDTCIFMPGFEMSLADRAKRPYQVLVPSAYNEALFPTLIKFMDPLRPDRTYTNGSRDYMVFRLAETHLMLAEALLQQGKTAEALTNVNIVRSRAAFAGKTAAMQITAAQLNMDFIMEERARELAGEQTRWMDLKRWGVLVDRVSKYNPQASAIKAFHNLRPLPQTQVDRVEDGKTTFPQNPGY